MTLLTLLRPRTTPYVAPLIDEAPIWQTYVTIDGTRHIIERAVLTSDSWPTDQAASWTLTFPRDSLGWQQLVADGYPLKGPHSPEVTVLRDTQVWKRGYIMEPAGDLRTGFVTLHCQDTPVHADKVRVGDTGRTNLLGNNGFVAGDGYTGWLEVNVAAAAGPSAGSHTGVTLTADFPDDDQDNPLCCYALEANMTPSDLTVVYTFTVYVMRGVIVPRKRAVQIVVYNPDPDAHPHILSTTVVDIDSPDVPIGAWHRLGPVSVTIPPSGSSLQARVSVWAPRDGTPISYSEPRLVADEVFALPGADSVVFMAALFNEATRKSHANMTALAFSAAGVYDPTGWAIPVREHPVCMSKIQAMPKGSWRWDPDARLVVCYATGQGPIRRDITIGTDEGHIGRITAWSSPSDGMATKGIALAPESDPAREEAEYDTSATLCWEVVADDPAPPDGTLPSQLGFYAQQAVGDRNTLGHVEFEAQMGVPFGGRCPADWLMPPWNLRQGQRLPARAVDGPIDVSGTPEIVDLKPAPDGSLGITVLAQVDA